MTRASESTGDDDALTWQMLAYYEAADHDLARWCVYTDLDPTSEAAVRAYDIVHEAYASLWLAMGDEFHERLKPLAAASPTTSGLGRRT